MNLEMTGGSVVALLGEYFGAIAVFDTIFGKEMISFLLVWNGLELQETPVLLRFVHAEDRYEAQDITFLILRVPSRLPCHLRRQSLFCN